MLRDTWKSFDALAMPSGLPSDMLTKTADGWSTANYTSPSDIAAYLWSTLAAEDLRIIDRDESARPDGPDPRNPGEARTLARILLQLV